MNLFRIFDAIAQQDEAIYDRISDRRASIKRLTDVGRKAGLTSMGLFLGGVLQKAYAGEQGTSDAASVLATVKFALQLERAELGLYQAAGRTNLFTGDNLTGLNTITANEAGHVAALEATLTQLGGDPNNMTMFPMQTADLTGSTNGTTPALVPNAMTNLLDCMSVLCTSEEAGGRAYRGNAYALMSNDAVLKAALQIHTVEARHAAYWRLQLGRMAWIERADANATSPPANFKGPALVHAKTGTTTMGIEYPNESNTTQAGKAGSSYTSVGDDRVAEAFDEGLDPNAVAALATPFGFKAPM